MGHTRVGWGGSCRGGMGHVGDGWVMQGWGESWEKACFIWLLLW